MSVAPSMRHTKARRCPVCDGAEQDPRGQSKRCSGFTSSDGEYAHCSREEHAGPLEQEDAGTYAHRLHGPCKCGSTHGESTRPSNDNVETVYEYVDEDRKLLYEVVRKPGKKFLQRRPDPSGTRDYVWNLDGVRRVLYRLYDLVWDDADRTVFIVEGEKDVDTLTARGLTATCNPGGAGKWSAVAELARKVLADRDVVVVADNDTVGHKHAAEVAASLRGVTRSLRVVVPTGAYKDTTALYDAGKTIADVVPMDPDDAPPVDAPQEETASEGPRWRSPIERAKALGGALVRLVTPIETLNAATRGGLPMGRSVVIGGAPDAGKSMLAGQLARHFARAGHYVGCLIDDEPVDDHLIRYGQQEGLRREDLEEGDGPTRALLAKALEELPHEPLIVDGDEDGADLEGVSEELHRRAGGPGVLVLDSLQTVRALGTAAAKSKKERVDCVVAAVRRIRKKHGHLIIATCELSRGAYRSRQMAERIDDLAAFKESGDIEYGFQVAMVLRTVPGGSGLVDVTFAKNKVGKKPPFLLSIDFASATLTEVPVPTEEEDDETPDDRARQRILAAVRSGKQLGDTVTKIAKAAGGEKQTMLRVAKTMVDAGELVLVGDTFRPSSEVTQ